MKTINIFFALVFFGVASTLSFGPFNYWPFGLLALFPIFYIIDHTSFNTKKTIYLGYFVTLSFNIFTAYWLFYTIIIYGHLHWSISAVVFILYTLIVSGRYIFFLLLIKLWKHLHHIRKINHIRLFSNKYLAYSFAWLFSEYFGWQLFHAMGANYAGGNKYLIQIGDIFGIYGVSVLWFLMSLMVYDLFSILVIRRGNFKPELILKNKSLIFTAVLLVLVHIYGAISIPYWEKKQKSYETKRFALIQGNAPLAFEGIRSVYKQLEMILDSISEQTEEVITKDLSENKKPDLVVWPEASVPFLNFQRPGIYSQKVKELQDKYHVPMVINDVFTDIKDMRRVYYNNMWLLDEDGKAIDYYHKIQLLPFGEFIPLGDKFPFLYKVAQEISGFTPGNDKKVLTLNEIHILPSICYELLPPQFTVNFYQKSGSKAQVIVNITNDAWFGPTIENAQHVKASALRAIEMRLPILRTTNAGTTAYIDITGNIINPTENFVKDTRVYDVPVPDKSHSIYSVVGVLPVQIFMIFGIILWGYAAYLGFFDRKPQRKS